jgi:hypothetical protein
MGAPTLLAAAASSDLPPKGPRTSPLALASLLVGIAGLFTCGLGGLVGLILGIVARVRIARSEGRLTGAGTALAGIIVSAVTLLLGLAAPMAAVLVWRFTSVHVEPREMVIEEVSPPVGRQYAVPAPMEAVEWPVSEGGNGHRYVRTPGPCTWAEAAAQAEALGGHLVTISSQAENDWVWQTFSGPDHGLWLGLTDVAEEGRWVWASGEPVTYTNWHPGEPNNLGDEDYAQLFRDGTWNDTNNHNWDRPIYGVIEIEPGRFEGSEGAAPAAALAPNQFAATIEAVRPRRLTVQVTDGVFARAIEVPLTDQTQVVIGGEATKAADLEVGQQVVVTTADDEVTAVRVEMVGLRDEEDVDP